jgi:hypothetical protein
VNVAGELRWLGALGLTSAVLAVGGCLTAGRALAAGDANETSCPVSTVSSPGFRPSLPDCRAYEIVSAADSGDLATVAGSYGFPDGVHVFYRDFLPTVGAGARNGLTEPFVATRTSSGWVQQPISPLQGDGPKTVTLGVQQKVEPVSMTGDFSHAFVSSPYQDPFEAPRLDQTTGVGVYSLLLASGEVETVSLPDSGVLTQTMIETAECLGLGLTNGCGMFLAGSSADGGRAFFVTTAKLVTAPGTPTDTHTSGDEIYERAGGHTYLVGVLPDGSAPACGAEVSQGISDTVKPEAAYSYGAVAPSGENVVFEANTCAENGLFLRDVVGGSTTVLPGSKFAGRAGTAAGEEEKIFTLGNGKLYEYHVGTGQVVEIGEGSLLAFSRDGSRVYFLNAQGIQVYHEGSTELIPGTPGGGYTSAGPFGKHPGGLIANGRPAEYPETSNMPVASGGESDGSHLLFIDTAQLTGYENKEHQEAYVYDAETGDVTCISCNPLRPNEPEARGDTQLITNLALDFSDAQYHSPSPPFISDDGSRAVFETTEALVSQDTNGTADVYEWERAGSEGCAAESLQVESLAESPVYSVIDGGCLYLLSSGLGREVPNAESIVDGTHLVGASENLEDIYIRTSESLLPGLDNASKLYDVRIDGGFPYASPSRGCEAGRCKAGGEPAMSGESTTEAFTGPGDVKSTNARHDIRSAIAARERKLMRALRSCRRRRDKRRRIVCERTARRRFDAGSGVRGGREGGSK